MPRPKKIRVWVSVLIPAKGAEVYDGARVQVSMSETEMWADLADWIGYDAEEENAPATSENIRLAMEYALENGEILMWKWEEQSIHA